MKALASRPAAERDDVAQKLPAMISAARRRRSWRVAAMGAPAAAVALVAAWRSFGTPGAFAAAAVALALLAWRIAVARRGIDTAWLVRGLDEKAPALQDSADLLFADPATLGGLQRLQRERVFRVLETRGIPELREAFPAARVAWLAAGAALACAALVFVRVADDVAPARRQAPPASTPDPPPSMRASLRITPPAYTGLPARDVGALSARSEEGSRVEWTLRLTPMPAAARLRFVDGTRLDLEAQDGAWHAARGFTRSTVYRLELEGGAKFPDTGAHRLDIVPDRPPRLTVRQPERTLTVLEGAQRTWTIAVEAADDHGLGDAHLEITLAQGSGEQVTVTRRRIALAGQGDAKQRRYEHRIDLAALGFAQGDDAIAAFEVRDRRAPAPNVARSPSFILRWPPPAGAEGTGVEGLVQKAMPAYFRSQRQIIIDTEALIAERPRLAADDALAKSDTIGADQRLLRLRYGQFLGEESEVEGEHHDEAPGEAHDDSAQGLMRGAGHLHDLPEAATLLDPATREILRSALGAMWEAERELRSGDPVAALPHERRALEFIKRAQQADRIYLARVGLELPALDHARRLTGERGALAARRDPARAQAAGRVAETAFAALQAGEVPALDTLAAWAAEQAARDAPGDDSPGAGLDPLAVLEAIDALQRDAACDACRTALGKALWPALVPPAAAPTPRPRADAVGNVYLDAVAVPEATP